MRQRTSVTDRARMLLRTVPPPRVPSVAKTVLIEEGKVFVVIPGHPDRHTVSFGPDELDERAYERTLFTVTGSMSHVVAEAGKNSAHGWAGFTREDLKAVIRNEIPSIPGWSRALQDQARACVAAARGVPREEIDRSILAAARRRAKNTFVSAAQGMAEAGATEEEMVDEVRRAIARQVIRG